MQIRRSQLPWIVSLVCALVIGWLWKFPQQNESSPGRVAGSKPQDQAAEESSRPDFGPIPRVPPRNGPVLGNLQRQKLAVNLTSPIVKELAGRMSRDTQGLQTMTHPDGRQSVNMKGRFSTVIAAVPGADGKTEVRCFTDHDELVNALSQTPPIAPTRHEK